MDFCSNFGQAFLFHPGFCDNDVFNIPSVNSVGRVNKSVRRRYYVCPFQAFLTRTMLGSKYCKKALFKAHLYILFTHAFSEMHWVLTLIEPTKVITRKTQRNAENACVNGMLQLGFKHAISTFFDACVFNFK